MKKLIGLLIALPALAILVQGILHNVDPQSGMYMANQDVLLWAGLVAVGLWLALVKKVEK